MKSNKKHKSIENLAEIVGIMLGDGCLYFDSKEKYQTIVSFHKNEKDYLYYVKALFENFFESYKFCITELKDEILLRNNSIFVGEKLKNNGLIAGNKTINKITIPRWITNDMKYMIKAIKGLFDTDGCVYRKYNSYAQIQFKLACKECVCSIRDILFKLHFNPTRIQKENLNNRFYWKIYLSRQKEIDLFFKLIKPANSKHIIRYENIKN